MNSYVLGLLTNVLVTSLLFPATALLDSAFAVESVEESNNNHLSSVEFTQKEILSSFDQATEHSEVVNIKGVSLEDLVQLQEAEEKLTLTTNSSSKLVGQEVSSPKVKAVAAFADKFTSEIETNESSVLENSVQQDNFVLAQEPVITDNSVKPSLEEVQEVQRELRNLDKIKFDSYYSSPSMSIYIPVGYGADKNTGFVAADYQERTRFGNNNDGEMVFGVGLGNAKKSVGVVLSYTLASVSNRYNSEFGIGGFNLKVHRQFKHGWAAAVGMNGIVNIGNYSKNLVNDFEKSLYGVVTKVIHTDDDINKPFSRIAVTAGVGNGQFRTENSINNDDDNFNVFGNVTVRVHPRASLITEWTGQDLAIGASIAPFKNIPLVITPAVRDIAGPGSGASDGARFVIGAGFGFKF